MLIWLSALALRFWGLSRFDTFVFDEVYYAKFGNNYLTGEQFFNAHPPFSQYFIALGIWLSSWPSPASYRWMNALIGSLIPVVVGAIAYQISKKQRYGILVASLACLDGLFLVESRYALSNVYLVLWGLLTQLFLLSAVSYPHHQRRYLILSGCCAGATVAVKWNGLGFLLGIYLLYFFAWGCRYILNLPNLPRFWHNLSQIKIKSIVFYLALVPCLIYYLLWIPHLLSNPQHNFWSVHQYIIRFHQSLNYQMEIHPYCSPWYSWILMWRPIAYFYQNIGTKVYAVYGMGNPILWWLSTTAILVVFWDLMGKLNSLKRRNSLPPYFLVNAYIIFNFGSNLFPWAMVKRCLFIYHYMSAYVFAWLALGWMLENFWKIPSLETRMIAIGIIMIIGLAFLYWLPIYLGLPLSETAFKQRIILPSWL